MEEYVIKFRPKAWTPLSRVIALKLAGKTQTKLAEELGVQPSTVGAVIRGDRKSRRVASHYAATIGVELHELWPEYKEVSHAA